MKNKKMIRRSLAIVLAIAMVVAYFPLVGNNVYAESQGGEADVYYALPGQDGDDSGYVAADEALTEDELDAQLQEQENADALTVEEEETADESMASGESGNEESEEDAVSECGLALADPGDHPGEVILMSGEGSGEDVEGLDGTDPVVEGTDPAADGTDPAAGEPEPPAEEPSYGMSVSVNSKGIATLYAYVDVSGFAFDSLYVDDEDTYTDVYGETVLDGIKIDMKDYPVGYHTVKLFLHYEDEEGNIDNSLYLYYPRVPTKIFSKPKLKLANFYTGIKYFTYKDNYNSYSYDSSCKVYLDYKKGKKGKWKKGYGPISSGDSKKKSKLKPASKYYARTYFAKKTKYTPPQPINADGTLGPEPATVTKTFKGPYAKSVGFKTGYKKTPVKKIKAKKIKQWCKKYKVRRLSSKVYYRYGYAGWGYYRKILGTKTYKYWYTKVRITVTMKKKPGVKGIYIGEKKVKGNKKTYKANFTLAGKKKGKKIKVSVYSYMSNTYGGWSGKTLKKVKVK